MIRLWLPDCYKINDRNGSVSCLRDIFLFSIDYQKACRLLQFPVWNPVGPPRTFAVRRVLPAADAEGSPRALCRRRWLRPRRLRAREPLGGRLLQLRERKVPQRGTHEGGKDGWYSECLSANMTLDDRTIALYDSSEILKWTFIYVLENHWFIWQLVWMTLYPIPNTVQFSNRHCTYSGNGMSIAHDRRVVSSVDFSLTAKLWSRNI